MYMTRNEFIDMFEGKTAGEIFDYLLIAKITFVNNRMYDVAKTQPVQFDLETPEALLRFFKCQIPLFEYNRPLAIGIQNELYELYPMLREFSILVSHALKLHVLTEAYLRKIQYREKRYHLSETVSGMITPKEKKHSANRVATLYPKVVVVTDVVNV